MSLASTSGSWNSPLPRSLRRMFLVPAAIYPLWHFAAPAGSVDPWWVWWVVAASFFAVAGASLVFRWVEKRLLGCFHACTSLITLQFFVLSALNDMAPFFVVAWTMSVLATVIFIRNVPNLTRYAMFLAAVGIVLYALAPAPHKLAYWGGTVPIVAGWYIRLRGQEAAALLRREHQEELERRVQERTSELAQANEMLRREMEECTRLEGELRFSQTMDAVGRLAGGVAHEFNNLLTAIRLYSELALGRAPDDSPLRRDIERIQNAAREAATVTEQLLDFSRGAVSIHEAVDLGKVAGEATQMLDPLMGDRIDVVWRLAGEALPICAETGQLHRLLLNLALNARDAMPEGGQLVIETRRLEPDDPRIQDMPAAEPAPAYASVTVSDNGIGMDAETREQIFDPFFSRKPAGAGTGLGLSIVYGIVRQTNAHIRVDSEPGKGTRIEIIWPFTDRPYGSPEGAHDDAHERCDERVLLVEDEPDLRSAMGRILSAAGYRVTQAGDGNAALCAAHTPGTHFDLVVTDVVMQGMSGVELSRQLRADHPSLPILLVSGHADDLSARSGLLPAEFGFLRKPFEAKVLLAKARETLDGRR